MRVKYSKLFQPSRQAGTTGGAGRSGKREACGEGRGARLNTENTVSSYHYGISVESLDE